MDAVTFKNLLERYLRDDLDEQELQQLLDSLQDPAFQEEWELAVSQQLEYPFPAGTAGLPVDAAFEKFRKLNGLKRTKRPLIRRLPWKAMGIAAAVIGMAILLNKVFIQSPEGKNSRISAKEQVLPGGNKAVLTLANGDQVILDTAGNGTIAQQGNVQVLQVQQGQLSFNGSGDEGLPGGMNTISTPKGGQYQVILTDGTKVWLNAASSLKFPTVFSGAKREVQLEGEAYFEVAGNAHKPFKVNVKDDMAIQVLGTHFNVMAYKDEQNIETTLLEGSVRVEHGLDKLLLKPGQQAQLPGDGKLRLSPLVDVENVVAWKNGYFQFERSDIPSILRQISRWYNVEIQYEGNIDFKKEFGGKLSRNSSIEEVLKALELSGVHFKLEGAKIVVFP